MLQLQSYMGYGSVEVSDVVGLGLAKSCRPWGRVGWLRGFITRAAIGPGDNLLSRIMVETCRRRPTAGFHHNRATTHREQASCRYEVAASRETACEGSISFR